MGSLLALLSGFCFALGSVTARFALRSGASVGQTVVMSLLPSAAFFGILALVPGFRPAGPGLWDPVALAWYAAAGILGSVVGRILNFRALQLLGPARLNQLVATDALFSVVLAYFLTGERLGTMSLAGIFVVTAGVMLLSTEGEAPRPGHRPGMVLGLVCALVYALRNILISLGNRQTGAPVWGAMVATWAAVLVYTAYLAAAGGLRTALPARGRGLAPGLLSGAAYVGAWLTLFYALRLEDPSVVTALKNTLPLFAIALSWLLLRQEERLNRRVAVSALVITAGVAMVL